MNFFSLYRVKRRNYSNWQQEDENIRAFIAQGNKVPYLISHAPLLLVFLIIMSPPNNFSYMTSWGNLIEDVL